jgi:hypothetical protein
MKSTTIKKIKELSNSVFKLSLILWGILLLMILTDVAFGQWLPVTVNTNTGVYKPINIASSVAAGLTNAYSTSGTVNRAYVSGQDVVVQFNTNVAASTAITNLVAVSGTNDTAYVSGLTGYVVFNTNGASFVYPDWYRPATNYNGSLLWYSFDTSNTSYIVDVTGNGNNGTSPFLSRVLETNAFKVSSVYESVATSDSSSIGNGNTELTMAAWMYFSSTLGADVEFMGSGVLSNSLVSSITFAKYGSVSYFRVVSPPTAYTLAIWSHGSAYSTGVWHRVVCTYKKNGAEGATGASVNIYFDGDFKTNAASANAYNCFLGVNTPWKFGIGSCQGATARPLIMWDGYMDDCIIANTAWTLGQVTNDFNAGRTLAP